jgi:hypothetical protein
MWRSTRTSCAAPLWAAFTSLVNQKRASGGASPLGLAAAAIYPLAREADYPSDWHDINDGSTNGHYPAVTGYDLATGWGSFQAAGLLADLAAFVEPSPSPSASPSHSPSPTPAPPPATGCNGTQGWPRATPTGVDASAASGVSMGLPLLVGWVASRGTRRRRAPKAR